MPSSSNYRQLPMLHSLTRRPLTVTFALAMTAALPAAAQIQKCQARDGTVSFSDRATCPDGTQPVDPRAAATPAQAGAGGSAAVPDAPLAILETGVPIIQQMPGKFAWLDADTLAITTYSDTNAKVAWMVRRIVAFDVPAAKATTLVPRGFLDCTDFPHNLVSLELGDLEGRFAVGSKSPPPVQQFNVWNPSTHALAPAPAELVAGWHPHACVKPAPEDLASADPRAGSKPVRYLEPEHGVLAWGLGDDGHPEPPSLRTPHRKTILPLSLGDVSHDVRYLPWAKTYQLSAGALDRAHAQPLVTMTVDGRVSRQQVPAALARTLDAAGASGAATMIAVRPGALLIQPGPARQGGGMYLVRGEKSQRVWCTAAPVAGQAAGDDACAISQEAQVSPDGCRIAFDATPAQASRGTSNPSVKILDLCTAADKGKARVATSR
jgi:hypothetical protein